MLSAEDIAATKLAVELCNSSALKLEILCAPGSEYDSRYQGSRNKKALWDEILNSKSKVVFQNLSISEQLQKKISGLILLIGTRMLIWTVYHEGTFELSPQYSIRFLKSSFFTTEGIIDKKKAAVVLVRDKRLSIKQRYKLACYYCLTDFIPKLHRIMRIRNRREFYDPETPEKIRHAEIIKFWTYYLMGKIDKLKGSGDFDEYVLKKAIESGSKAAVEYCLSETNILSKDDTLINAAEQILRTKIMRQKYSDVPGFPGNLESDWIIFRGTGYNENTRFWVPNYYYTDILVLLMLKMREDQLITFLKKDINVNQYTRPAIIAVLQYVLDWPYQVYFMTIVRLAWEFLPENYYTDLLLKICEKSDPVCTSLKNGEEKYYNYRKLLKEFWCETPDNFKRYVFDAENFDTHTEVLTRIRLILFRLLVIHDFTLGDWELIELILTCATTEEKKNIIYSSEGTLICIQLVRMEKWSFLDMFVLNCFQRKQQVEEFKRRFVYLEDVQEESIDLIKTCRTHVFNYLMKWSALPEEEITTLKKTMINSDYAKVTCINLAKFHETFAEVENFIRWFPLSDDEFNVLKREILLRIAETKTENLIIPWFSEEEDMIDNSFDMVEVEDGNFCKTQ